MATTAVKPTIKAQATTVAPKAPETAKAIEAVMAETSATAVATNLAKRTVRFSASIPSFVFREGGRLMEFRNGIYDATGDEIVLLRHAASRAWWLAEVAIEAA